MWGAENSMIETARAALKLGYDVELVCASSKVRAEWASRVNDRVHLVNSPSGRLARIIPIAARLFKIPRRDAYIIFDPYTFPAAIIGLLAKRLRDGTRLIFDVHDSARRNPKRRFYLSLTRFADLSICVSEYIRGQLPARAKSIAIARGVERISVPESEDGLVVVVGRVTPEKRVDLAIEAVRLSNSGVVLEIRGAGNPEYEEQIRKLGDRVLGRRFRWAGRVAHERVLNGAAALLFLNDDEPSGRSIAEAQASGVIVIAPDRGGASEFVADHVTGYLYESGNAESCAKAIDRWFSSDADNRQILSNAERAAREGYDPQNQAAKYVAAVAGQSRSSRASFDNGVQKIE